MFWIGGMHNRDAMEGLRPQEPFLNLDDSTVFLYAGLWIARKIKATVITSIVEQ